MFENSKRLYFNTCKIKQVSFQKAFKKWIKSSLEAV